MKRKTLGLIHTSATLVPVFAQLCKEKLPNVDVFNIADDSLIKDVIRRGELTPLWMKLLAGRKLLEFFKQMRGRCAHA